jgi:hypothetical protein
LAADVDYELEYNNRARVPEKSRDHCRLGKRCQSLPRDASGPLACNSLRHRAAGIATRFATVPGANHFTAIAPLADAHSPMVSRLRELAGR